MKYKTGAIAGAFDVIHPGYIEMMKDAKTVCDFLIIFLHDKPDQIFHAEDRKKILQSIKYVDSVVIYKTEEELDGLLAHVDVRILGSDHEGSTTRMDLKIPTYYHPRNHDWSATKYKNMISEHAPNPTIYVFCGPPCSGKSTTANLFAEKNGLAVYSVDSACEDMFSDQKLSEIERDGCYRVIHEMVSLSVRLGNSCVLDGTYARQKQQRHLEETALSIGVKIVVTEMKVSAQEAQRRFMQREGHPAKDLTIVRVGELANTYPYGWSAK